jgi:hypothetical protein
VRYGGQQQGSRQEHETWCRGLEMVKHRSGTRWPDDRESGDAVCGLHRAKEDEEHVILVWHQNQGR